VLIATYIVVYALCRDIDVTQLFAKAYQCRITSRALILPYNQLRSAMQKYAVQSIFVYQDLPVRRLAVRTPQEKRTQSWQRLPAALPRLMGVDNRGQVVHWPATAMASESCYVALQSQQMLPKGQS
jgi:hypothetical protein